MQTWHEAIGSEKSEPYFQHIIETVKEERGMGRIIYPPAEDVFNAFRATEFGNVKVVILGQDPYHGAGQAHGLAFSVREGVAVPPSLVNIYKELADDIEGFSIPQHGYLQHWAEQGVLHKVAAVNGYILCSHAQHECNDHCHDHEEAEAHHSAFILVCTECGTADEQTLSHEWAALCAGVAESGFALKEEHVVLTGICKKCQK